MKKVEIFLSTYNGDRYIREQLDSILDQKGEFELMISIRDDGSSDQTCQILREYEKDARITIQYGNNIGVNHSIMYLVHRSTNQADYYSFADQDDLWYPHRIQTAIDAFEQESELTPILWSCAEELTDQNLTIIGHLTRPKHLGNFYNAMLQNKIPGHTQILNRRLFLLVRDYPPSSMYLYDRVVYMTACAFGRVIYGDVVCGKYRQHNFNEIGYESNKVRLFFHRVRFFFKGNYQHNADQLSYFRDYYQESLDSNHDKEIVCFLISRKHWWKRLFYVFRSKLKNDSLFEALMIRVGYLLGAFGSHIE